MFIFDTLVEKKTKNVATAFANAREPCYNLFKGCTFRVGYNLVNLLLIPRSSYRVAKDTLPAKAYTIPNS